MAAKEVRWYERVAKCEDCPLVRVGDHGRHVDCYAGKYIRAVPIHERVGAPPSWCPLRTGPLTVKLATSAHPAPHRRHGGGARPDAGEGGVSGKARHTCTAADPWTPAKAQRALHPDAVDDGECAEGCCDYLKCPHCGHRWRQELPQ
jgi:hypothetical protein